MRIVLLATAVYIFSGCGNPEENEDPAKKFIGQWTIEEDKREVTLTTNSDQIVIDRSSQGTGVIEISGEVNVALKYLAYVSTVGGDTTIGVYSLPPYSRDTPYYLLWCSTIGESKHISFDDGYTVSYFGTADFSFHNYTLVINNVSLNNNETDSSITINGTLTGVTINIPANIPTRITKLIDSDPKQTLIIKEDNSFIWIREGKYSTTGIWELESDTITFYDVFGELVPFAYSFSDEKLVMSFEDRPCSWVEDNPYEYENCLNSFEEVYNLEKGSLDDIIYHVTLLLIKSNDGILNMALELENYYYKNQSLRMNVLTDSIFYSPD